MFVRSAYREWFETGLRYARFASYSVPPQTEDGIEGRECIMEMEDILRGAGRR